MKLLVMIPNFGTHQIDYLKIILDEYKKFKYINVTIKIFGTNIVKDIDSKIEQIIFNENIGYDLSKKPREYMFDHKGEYDLYMHQENDTLITENNILTWIKLQYNCEKEIIGFLRYEIKDNIKYLIDMDQYSDLDFTYTKNDNNISNIINIHQGGWLIPNDLISHIEKLNINYGNYLEDSCSNFYKSNIWPGSPNGIPKKIPKTDIDNLLIYHLPNKYINIAKYLPSIDDVKRLNLI